MQENKRSLRLENMETLKIENPREKYQVIKPDRAMMIPQNVEERTKESTPYIDKNTSLIDNKQHTHYIAHMSGLTPYYLDRLIDIFCENLKRFLNKQELVNVVDKTRGY